LSIANSQPKIEEVIPIDSTLNRGRPSKPQQLTIERTLREFFAKAASATFASQKTGYDIKTVAKYYNQFQKDIRDVETKDYHKRFDEESQKFLYAYDELCYSLYQDKMEIQDMITHAKKTSDLKTIENLYRIKQKINSNLINLVLARFNLSYRSIISF
jgi:hypothetical protein